MEFSLGRIFLCCFLAPAALALSNGDVSLIGNYDSSIKEGLLQVYLDGKNGTVCCDNFNIFAAHAACRELGFVMAKGFMGASTDSKYNTLNTSILLTNVTCPKVKHPKLNGALHLLRCSYSSGPGKCASNDSVVVTCDGEKLRENPYNSQVWVKSNSQSPNTPSEGKLQIYLNKEWGSFCYEGFNQLAADTVCLQKGFTNAVHLGHQSDSNDVYWLSDVSCLTARSCLYQCFDYPEQPLDECPNGYIATIKCTFNSSLANSEKPGSQAKCDLKGHSDNLHGILTGILVTSVILILIIIITIFVTCYFFTKCPLYMYRKRSHYRLII